MTMTEHDWAINYVLMGFERAITERRSHRADLEWWPDESDIYIEARAKIHSLFEGDVDAAVVDILSKHP